MEGHNGERQSRKKIGKDKRSFKGSRDKQRKMLHNCLLVLEDSAFSLHVSLPMLKYPLSPSSKCWGLFQGQFLWECPGVISSQSRHQ